MAVTRKIVAEIAETITAKRRLYESAYTAELDRLRARHGPGAVLEALSTLDPRSVTWDADGHRRMVERGVGRALAEHRDDEAPAPSLPPAWK
jgi:hypothetical protein